MTTFGRKKNVVLVKSKMIGRSTAVRIWFVPILHQEFLFISSNFFSVMLYVVQCVKYMLR